MKVKLLSHTQISQEFFLELCDAEASEYALEHPMGKLLALTAIRTCYSPNKPSDVIIKEGEKYLKSKATDGGKGSDADRLIRFIQQSGHTSTLEGLSFNFAIEGVSRALLAQLTRHRVGFSFSVQSQRYVKQSTDSRHGGFDYVIPEKVKEFDEVHNSFKEMMRIAQMHYDMLIQAGVPQEDARAVLPNAATCNLVMTANLTALLSFYSKRKPGAGAQKEITELAELLKAKVVSVEPWTEELFNYEPPKKKSEEEKLFSKILDIVYSEEILEEYRMEEIEMLMDKYKGDK